MTAATLAAAGEIGTVYQAVGWCFIGNSLRQGKYHDRGDTICNQGKGPEPK